MRLVVVIATFSRAQVSEEVLDARPQRHACFMLPVI